MNHQKIAQIENLFRTGQKTVFNFKKVALNIPNENDPLPIIACRPKEAYNSYHYVDSTVKEKIVIHHTAGHLQGDLASLTRKNYHVSVPFVIARDGTIYQLHHSKYWSYHLGRSALGGNATQSKKGIGIELSNYGYLVPRGQHLETYHSRMPKPNGIRSSIDRYCSREETDLYVKLNDPYRKYTYYAAFTDAQYTSLIRLLRYLTKTYQIPSNFLAENIRYAHTQKVVPFKGIVTHVNYRKDKFDIGPVFDWQRIIDGLQAANFGGNIDAQIERANAAYLAAEKAFQTIQVKIWDTNSESVEDTAALKMAEKDLVAAYLLLQKAKLQGGQNTSTAAENAPIVTEDDIEVQMPLIGSRTLQHYGEDGPEEILYDYDFIE